MSDYLSVPEPSGSFFLKKAMAVIKKNIVTLHTTLCCTWGVKLGLIGCSSKLPSSLWIHNGVQNERGKLIILSLCYVRVVELLIYVEY